MMARNRLMVFFVAGAVALIAGVASAGASLADVTEMVVVKKGCDSGCLLDHCVPVEGYSCFEGGGACYGEKC